MTKRQDFLNMDDKIGTPNQSIIALLVIVGMLCALLCATAVTGYDAVKENVELRAKLEQCSK